MVTEQIQWNFGMAKDILRPSKVKYRQKKQEIKPRLFDISRVTVFERNSGEGRRSECLPKGGECYHLHLSTRLLSTQ